MASHMVNPTSCKYVSHVSTHKEIKPGIIYSHFEPREKIFENDIVKRLKGFLNPRT
jgi:hypothetical protein